MKVVLAKLPPEQKRKAWVAIQRDAPSLAEFMQGDICMMLCEKLNMSVVIEVEDGRVIKKKMEEKHEANKRTFPKRNSV